MNSCTGDPDRRKRRGDTPNCRAKARVKPSCESKTKSNATSTTLREVLCSSSAAAERRRSRMYSKGDFPVTERIQEQVLSLPMYAEITPEQQMRVAGVVRAFVE